MSKNKNPGFSVKWAEGYGEDLLPQLINLNEILTCESWQYGKTLDIKKLQQLSKGEQYIYYEPYSRIEFVRLS